MKKILFTCLLTILIFTACSPAQQQTATAVIATTIPTKPAATTTTAPTETPEVLPTATATVVRPTLTAISLTNASQLSEETLLGDGILNQVKASPDGKLIAYASSIGIRILDKETLQELGFLSSTSAANSIDFSPDGKLLVAGYENGHINIYTVTDVLASASTTVEPLKVIKAHSSAVTKILFSTDNNMFASISSDRTVVTWNASTGKMIHTFAGFKADITDAVFTADDRFIAVGSYDGTIRVWTVSSGYLWKEYGTADGTRKLRQLYPRVLLFDESTGRLISGWGDGTILIWQWEFGNDEPFTIALGENSIISLNQLDKQTVLSVDFNGSAIIWNTASDANLTGVEKVNELDLGKSIKNIDITTDQNIWVIGKSPATIEVFNLTDVQITAEYSRPGQGTQQISVAFTQDDNLLVSGGSDGVLRVWDVDASAAPLEITLAKGTAIQSLTKSADQRWLAVAIDQSVILYSLSDLQDAYNGKLAQADLQPQATIQTGGIVAAASISADGTILATANTDSNIIQLWSLPEGQKLVELTKVGKAITALAFSPSGNTLAAGSSEKIVYLWSDLSAATLSSLTTDETLIPVKVKGNIDTTALTWSAQANFMMVSGTSSQGMVVNTETNKVRYYLPGATKNLYATAVSPDGSLIATAGEEGLIRIYNSETKKIIATLAGHTSSVTGLLFTASGNRLVSCGEDGTIRLWSIAS